MLHPWIKLFDYESLKFALFTTIFSAAASVCSAIKE